MGRMGSLLLVGSWTFRGGIRYEDTSSSFFVKNLYDHEFLPGQSYKMMMRLPNFP